MLDFSSDEENGTLIDPMRTTEPAVQTGDVVRMLVAMGSVGDSSGSKETSSISSSEVVDGNPPETEHNARSPSPPRAPRMRVPQPTIRRPSPSRSDVLIIRADTGRNGVRSDDAMSEVCCVE